MRGVQPGYPRRSASPGENFAETLEAVCVDTVQAGSMTKDLALLVGKETKWLTTQQFLDCLDQELSKRMD